MSPSTSKAGIPPVVRQIALFVMPMPVIHILCRLNIAASVMASLKIVVQALANLSGGPKLNCVHIII